jgi:PAS domain S-box-containing protein
MISFEAFEETLRYVRWSSEDAEALRALLPIVDERKTAIAEDFYERIREHPEAARVFRDDAQVRRLQQTLTRWLVELVGGPHDRAYFEQRCRIGGVHARLGVAQRYVFAAMSLVRRYLGRLAEESLGHDPALLARVHAALDKILDVELSVMLETYRGALLERVRHVDALEREGLAQRLAAAEERYRDAIASAQAVIVVLDEEGRVLLWNRLAAHTTGWDADETVGRHILEQLLPDDARERISRVTPEAPITFEAALVARTGRVRHLRWFVSATVDPERHARTTYLFGVDLTDVHETEERARHAARLAAVGTMAAGLAHEIRNPLNAASLHVSLLERSLEKLASPPAAAIEAASVLKTELRRLSMLVSEFLQFARPRPLGRAPQDLVALTASVVELMRPDAAEASVELSLEPTSRLVAASVDAERIRQVLINLVKNGLDACRGEHGRAVTLRVRRVGLNAEIDVEDDGPGVPEGAPIFDAFFTTKEAGTGLGLALVHRIATDHGGEVLLRSRPGETIFTLRLPVELDRATGVS